MRSTGLLFAAVMALAAPVALGAAERATAIRAGELKQQPFLDAAGAGAVTANQPVSITGRQGGWVRVESNGQTGWMRMLNVRLDSGERAAPSGNAGGGNANALGAGRGNLSPASLLHTGSSGKTVTTGIKGLDEADIRNASANPQQVEQLDTLAVDAAEASAHAASSGLKEQTVEYLKKGRK